MPTRTLLLTAALAAALLPVAAIAADKAKPSAAGAAGKIVRLGGIDGWDAFADNAPGGKICFLVGKPRKSAPAGLERENVQFSVTHRPADKVANVVNFTLGYRAKPGADAVLDIGGRAVSLFTDKDGAWTRDAATDLAAVNALARAKRATLKAVPAKGPATVDEYDLKGFAKSLALIDKACGVRR